MMMATATRPVMGIPTIRMTMPRDTMTIRDMTMATMIKGMEHNENNSITSKRESC